LQSGAFLLRILVYFWIALDKQKGVIIFQNE